MCCRGRMVTDRVAVVGPGQIGTTIALAFGQAGMEAVLVGRRRSSLERGRSLLEESGRALREGGTLDEGGWAAVMSRISFTTSLVDGLADCVHVVEAINEDIEQKRALLAEVESLVPASTVLASTTSALSPTELQRDMSRPERFLVTHYAQPAHLMPVCEVVPGDRTTGPTVTFACGLLDRCDIRPVVCADVPGFVFSRLQFAVLREAVALVEQGVVSAADLDVVVKHGYAARLPVMGPLEHADLAGLDLMVQIAETIWPALDCSPSPSGSLLARLAERGDTGMDSGRGFHSWTTEEAAAFKAARDRHLIRTARQRTPPARTR